MKVEQTNERTANYGEKEQEEEKKSDLLSSPYLLRQQLQVGADARQLALELPARVRRRGDASLDREALQAELLIIRRRKRSGGGGDGGGGGGVGILSIDDDDSGDGELHLLFSCPVGSSSICCCCSVSRQRGSRRGAWGQRRGVSGRWRSGSGSSDGVVDVHAGERQDVGHFPISRDRLPL